MSLRRFAATLLGLAALSLILAAIPAAAQTVDTDGDGLLDEDEIALGTDPNLYDTDGDGFVDNHEVLTETDPLDPSSVPPGDPADFGDSDGDILTDNQEAELGTDPDDADTDDDGLTDGGEIGFEPGAGTGTDPLLFDTDGDGAGDGAEVEAGTDPIDPDSHPAPADPPADQDAAVTIYMTACPPGYDGDDFYPDCYDRPVIRQDFFLARGEGGISGATDNAGFVTLVLPADALPGRATAQTVVPPVAAGDFVVYCTTDDGATVLDVEQAVGAPSPDGSTTYLASFDVAPGDQIRCDWYNIPPGEEPPDPDAGSLTIYATSCPAGYDGTEFFEDCYGNPAVDLEFAAYNQKSDFSVSGATDEDGFVTLSLPAAGLAGDIVGFGQSPPVEVPGGADAPFVVSCALDNGQTPVEAHYGLIQLDPGGDAWDAEIPYLAGQDVFCDWYLLPASDEPTDPPAAKPTPPVKRLPNTGAGATIGEAEETRSSMALALILVGSMTVVATFAVGRKHLA